jgi:ribose 5-phosphate isomerase B
MSREHDDAHVLCTGERAHGPGLAEEIPNTWLEAEFSQEERHSRRVAKIRALEGH